MYKIKIRVGEHEFEAEGPEDMIRSQFLEFKEMIRLVESRRPRKTRGPDSPYGTAPCPLPDPAWAEVFAVNTQRRRLSLRPPLGPEDAGTALVALMYGYRSLLNMPDIPVTCLSEDMKESGLTRFTRLDRIYNPLHREGLATSTGRGKGTKYRVTNKGARQAQDWIKAALSKLSHHSQ